MRKITPFLYSLLVLLFLSAGVQAQQDTELLSLSGVVVDQSTANSIPYVTIKNKTATGSIMADSTGYFSLKVHPGDTLLFEAMSYRSDQYVVPEDAAGGHFAIIEVLQQDAELLEEVTIRGFPTQQQFEQAFLNVDPGELPDNRVRLNQHLEEVSSDETNMQEYIDEYNARQRTYWIREEMPPNDFLNPERWVQFIRDWREGRFTDENVEKLEGFPEPEEDEVVEEQNGGE